MDMMKEQSAACAGVSEKASITNESGETLIWEEVGTEHVIWDKWIDFRKTAYRFPDGQIIDTFYTYSCRDYVVVVAFDTEGKVLCERQFRQGIKSVTTEFPAGAIERDTELAYGMNENRSITAEDALAAAKRELLEETGHVSEEWTHLLTIPSNATMTDNNAHIFAARNCRKVTGQSLDETEYLSVMKLTPDEVENLIHTGQFQQAVHVAAWHLTKQI
ncbi:MAG: NUDIX hydrolase [Lachnospiraceae bacterium]